MYIKDKVMPKYSNYNGIPINEFTKEDFEWQTQLDQERREHGEAPAETKLPRFALAKKWWWDMMEEGLAKEMQIIRQRHGQVQRAKSVVKSTPPPAKKKSAKKVKPSKKKAELDDALRNFPVLLTFHISSGSG